MANILKLSKRQPDLLNEVAPQSQLDRQQKCFEKTTVPAELSKQPIEGAPAGKLSLAGHELAANKSRVETVEGIVAERRLLTGTAHAEHFINELYSASQINRGPPGFSLGSRLHFDLLTGRDDRITYGDYLNFEERYL